MSRGLGGVGEDFRTSRSPGAYAGLAILACAREEAAMSLLHYGSELCIRLDEAGKRHVMETVGNHATRGGWVTVTDTDGQPWSFLVSPGVPIWISEKD
jgi:hypothetical protein